ncbi:hypothetical protein [Campylobacter concisus]|nr:hypothetical protein [Campylobacter concisus]
MKKRDQNILSHIRREISLSTRVKKDKSKYSRKLKHKCAVGFE